MQKRHTDGLRTPEKIEAAVDEMVEESFPASDPPAYSGGFRAGAPKRKSVEPKKDD